MREIAGLKVLIVEDEPIVAMMLEDMLDELGCRVVGSAATLEEGLRLADAGGFDLALLDINLNGRRSDPIATALGTAGKSFVYATGYGAAAIPRGNHAPVLQKPYTIDQLSAALSAAPRPA